MLTEPTAPLNLGLRIGMIDTLPFYRAGVAEMLRTSGAGEVVAQGQSADEAVRIANEIDLDLLLFDPEVSPGGADAVKSIIQRQPELRLVILTSSEDARNISWALRQGVQGYILRNVDAPELLSALKVVTGGGVYLTPSLGARLMARPTSPEREAVVSDAFSSLTPREKKILSVLTLGATNKEIARELNIAEATVKYFMTSIMQKLQVRNRVEAALEERRRMAAVEQARTQNAANSFAERAPAQDGKQGKAAEAGQARVFVPFQAQSDTTASDRAPL